MGKAGNWFRGLLGQKRLDSSFPPTTAPKQPKPKEKRRWSFVKSQRDKDRHPTTTKPPLHHALDVAVRSSGHVPALYPDKHAIAVAAVAEVAVAAAQAAAAVVGLTDSGRCAGTASETAANVYAGTAIREEWAAIKIQSAFRGCLVSIYSHSVYFFILLFVSSMAYHHFRPI
ncbi:hypothetical protein L6164_019508 [Bauhinia variegata]|uniref:Uncharacterized protein n=1 Tax=Bauhinia variegata TaxID=167791 RepID=A0ACB9MSA9_BAUVA|nr:hypothetical protein L6164_019508 [Bauhinia variegata]